MNAISELDHEARRACSEADTAPQGRPPAMSASPRLPVQPRPSGADPHESHLAAFEERYAELVASWIRSELELMWLAPGVVSPITAGKVRSWGDVAGKRLLFWHRRWPVPTGYGELHRMPQSSDQWWIGHLIVDPDHRRCGLGRTFVRHLLARAFGRLEAKEVLLLVVPQNRPAIRCYERNGFLVVGTERRYFKAPGRQHWFMRMVITRTRFHQWESTAGSEASARATNPSSRIAATHHGEGSRSSSLST